MNRLPFEKRRMILNLMVEGNSVRGIARLVDVSPVTVLRYLEVAGHACAQFHDAKVLNLKCRRVQCDEIWSVNYCKRSNVAKAKAAPIDAGDVWTWIALDSDSKLLVSYYVGDRSAHSAHEFMRDVAARISSRTQLTTDGLKTYIDAVEGAFGFDIDFAQLVKIYGETYDHGPARKYSPGICLGAYQYAVTGNPDPLKISTSHVEKHNQSMRQHMKRFTRLTAAHSKKLANHAHMIALYTVWYNFVRINSAVRMSPAMAAGVTERLWEISDLVKVLEDWEDRQKQAA